MYYFEIHNKKYWPYHAILHSDGKVEGNILPIIYDNATIELYASPSDRYSICYKQSKNILGKQIDYVDIIHEVTGETFSLQTDNIFVAKIVDGDLHIICKIGNEIRLYSNFWKTEMHIEIDEDKSELTPLWYHDIFIGYTDEYFFPIYLDPKKRGTISQFYDYYGYKFYEDDTGISHFIMFIDIGEEREQRYFVDNFTPISQEIDFWSYEEYVTTWDIDEEFFIIMETTLGNMYFIDRQGNLQKWTPLKEKKTFTYTRFFEDTDSNVIVGKNNKGLFLIERNKQYFTKGEIDRIFFFKDFIKHCTCKEGISFFLVETMENEIVILNDDQAIVSYTMIENKSDVVHMECKELGVIEITLKNGKKEQYLLE